MSISKSISEEYYKYDEEYGKEYGNKMVVIMAVGSFYEILEEREKKGKLEKMAKLLNIMIGGKANEKLPKFVGFPKVAMTKYIPILIDDGYTVIVVDESKEKKGGRTVRRVSGIYSSSIYPMQIEDNRNDDTLMGIVMEIIETRTITNVIISIGNLNMRTNEFEMYERGYTYNKFNEEAFEDVLDNIMRIMVRYNVGEIVINVNKEYSFIKDDRIKEYLNIQDKNIYINKINEDYKNIEVQEEYLKKVYKHIEIGMMEMIEYMRLERNTTSILNCIYMIEFVRKHDEKYIENIAIPKIINEYEHLLLEMNTVQQLNIIENNNRGSLLDIIDKTSTMIGKRGLRELICKPYNNKDKIQERYNITEEMEERIKGREIQIDKLLEGICDFEKVHRRMTLGIMKPNEMYKLDKTYKNIIRITEELGMVNYKIDKRQMEMIMEYIQEYNDIFEIEEMKKTMYDNNSVINFFKRGRIEEIDKIYNRIKKIHNRIEEIRKEYCEAVKGEWIKIIYTEQDGYHFTSTTKRTKILEETIEEKFIIKKNKNVCKITTKEIERLSCEITNERELYNRRNTMEYNRVINELVRKHCNVFDILKEYIKTIDITKSNIKCKKMYNYCKPTIEGDESFIRAKGMRHPIIERINNETEYIPNDIELTKEKNGIILYALNSGGKSSLLRAIGLCTIMAQSGLYVPCEEFKYSPYNTIITQVDFTDNYWKAHSSYITEMIGLRKITEIADEKCLVLADELTKGTEVISATSIFASSIIELVEKECNFVFTTHLHEIPKIEEIEKCKKVKICHLGISINDDGVIIFERKLQDGPCSELYGLEVARAVGLNKKLMNRAFEIRRKLVNKKSEEIKIKKSRYNASKIISECEICGYKPDKTKYELPIDTHHIEFQCNADESGFNKHYHKNSKFNLVGLCKGCHIRVHNNEIKIEGYKSTTNGKKLVYEIFKGLSTVT